MPQKHPAAFRRQSLTLLDDGRTVCDATASLGIAKSCLHRWKRQERIELRSPTGVSDADRSDLAAAKQRVRDLEEEVKILRKAAAAVEDVVPQRDVSASSRSSRLAGCGCARRATRWASHRRGTTTGRLNFRPRAPDAMRG